MDDDERKKDEAVRKVVDDKNLKISRGNRKRFASTEFGHVLGEGPTPYHLLGIDFILSRLMGIERYLEEPRNYQSTSKIDFKKIDLQQALYFPRSLAPVIDDFNDERTLISESTIATMWFRLVSQYFEWIAGVSELCYLDEKDKIQVIVSHLCKVICFNVAYTNYQINNGGEDRERFWFGRGFYWDSARCVDPNMNKFAEKMLKVMNFNILPNIRRTQMKKEEFVMLKLVLLFDVSHTVKLSAQSREFCASRRNKYRTHLVDYIRSQVPIESPELSLADIDSVTLKRARLLLEIPQNVEMMGEFDDESLAEMVRTDYGGMNGVLQNQIHTESKKKSE
ncbi:unnamed protein product [Caenorhabditis angaria]|uniref:NR LBD domain-containing protein n=1 Tax=Caenorhabditis angaria TaxID=860376 RepID=A0A9P1N3J0_9PELO|nr:unnamed protein product [Caenorhabditis angaria]